MTISLITALVELCIVLYLVYLFSKHRNKKIILASAMVLFLALYQFSEYMLCNTTHTEQWARFGFAVYTFIPAISLNLFLTLSNKRNMNWIYIFPTIFALIALTYPHFIAESTCKLFYVSISSLVFRQNVFMLVSYLTYYSLATIVGFYIFSQNALKTMPDCFKSRIATTLLPLASFLGIIFFIIYNIKYSILQISFELISILCISIILSIINILSFWLFKSYKKYLNVILLLIILAFLANIVLFTSFTQFSYDFSSVWCHFAFLYSITCLLYSLVIVKNKTSAFSCKN